MGMKAEADNGKFQSDHLEAFERRPMPNAYLVAQTSTGDNIGIGWMVLDRPGCPGMSFETGEQSSTVARRNLDGMIPVRARHGPTIVTKGDRNRRNGPTARRSLAILIQFILTAQMWQKGTRTVQSRHVLGVPTQFARDVLRIHGTTTTHR